MEPVCVHNVFICFIGYFVYKIYIYTCIDIISYVVGLSMLHIRRQMHTLINRGTSVTGLIQVNGHTMYNLYFNRLSELSQNVVQLKRLALTFTMTSAI